MPDLRPEDSKSHGLLRTETQENLGNLDHDHLSLLLTRTKKVEDDDGGEVTKECHWGQKEKESVARPRFER